MLSSVVTNRQLLFLGCSLSADRTVQALVDIKNHVKLHQPQHFAFLPLDDDTDREVRRQELIAANINPIWYPFKSGDDHDEYIEALLVCLVDGGLDG